MDAAFSAIAGIEPAIQYRIIYIFYNYKYYFVGNDLV